MKNYTLSNKSLPHITPMAYVLDFSTGFIRSWKSNALGLRFDSVLASSPCGLQAGFLLVEVTVRREGRGLRLGGESLDTVRGLCLERMPMEIGEL